MTATTLPVPRRPNRNKASRESPTSPTVLDRYFLCISIGPRKRTRRGQKVGKVMLTECLSSWVFALTSNASKYNKENVDRSILRCRCRIARGDRPGYSAKPAGHNSLLSRKYLSATEWHPGSLFAQSCSAIQPAYLGRLGQRPLVHEPGYQSYLRRIGDVATAVVASVSKGGLPTVQPSQASPYSRILFERSR